MPRIELECPKCLDVKLSVSCGQSFRWRENPDGSFHGIVEGKTVDVAKKDNLLIFLGTTQDDVEKLWLPYFDFERDYSSICEKISADAYLEKATKEFYGIRILHQKPWETLCSFIISQNNNIPRIEGIIDRLCENFGEKVGEKEKDYSFPDFQVISQLTEEDLAPLRAGFRNKYIIDAAKKVASGEVDLEKIKTMPIEQARLELTKIKGVGAKVAECTLLYGFSRMEAFPIDVWVKRIMAEMYPDGLPDCTKDVQGIAQQYLFHWRRNSKLTEFED